MSNEVITGKVQKLVTSFIQWFDCDYAAETVAEASKRPEKVEWIRTIPFCVLHLGCLGVIWTGTSWLAVGLAFFLYFIRMFAITGFYHRYFSHRTFTTSRFMQFVFAVWGGAWVAAEMGQKDMAAQGFQKFLTLSQDSDKVSKAKAALKRLGK